MQNRNVNHKPVDNTTNTKICAFSFRADTHTDFIVKLKFEGGTKVTKRNKIDGGTK